MNAVAAVRRPSMEQALRDALTNKKSKALVCRALNWDESQASRFLSGQLGLTIDKVDDAITALNMVVTTRRYMDFLAFGSQIGAACHCARAGMGECSLEMAQ